MSAVGSDTGAGQIIAYENMALLNKDSNPMIETISRYAPLDIIIQSGFPYEPQNEEEAKYIQMKMMQMQQAAQSQQDPMAIAANAEMMKAQASLIDKQVDQFNAETSRMKVMIDAEKVGADINMKRFDSQMKVMGMMQNAQSMRM